MNEATLIINRIIQIYIFIVIIDVFLGYFMSPYHPVRQFFDQLVNPLLNPIRKIVPPLGGIDFSPLVLIILLQVIGYLIGSVI